MAVIASSSSCVHHHLPSAPPCATSKRKTVILPHQHLLDQCRTPSLVLTANPPLEAARRDSGLLFREKLQFLKVHLGLEPFHALSLNPNLRATPLPHLHLLRSVLSSFGLENPSDVARILLMYPRLLTSDPHDLLPNLHFLRHRVPLPSPCELRLAILRCPRLLVTSVDLTLVPSLHFLRRIGVRLNPHSSLLLVTDVEHTLLPKMQFIESLGFSPHDAAFMVSRFPAILTFSIDRNLRPKVEFLLQDMGRNVYEIRGFPQYFGFSLEGRIKPRHATLQRLGFRRLPLASMLLPSDGEFQDRLIEMHLRSVEKSSPTYRNGLIYLHERKR